ncbi:MAG: hypothetical protein ACFFBP_16145 [Promethearchaeota archaeon]
MVDPNIWTYLNGISASITCIMGYIVGLVALFRYLKQKRNALTYVIYIGFLMGTFYLDVTLSFFMVLVLRENYITPLISGWIAFTPAIFLIGVLSRLATKTFLVQIEKLAIALIIILVPIFLIVLYAVPIYFGDAPNLILGGFEDEISHLVKHQAEPLLLSIISFFLVLNVYFFSGGFYKLSRNLEGEQRKRCLLLSWGFLIFSIGNFIDMSLPSEFRELTTIILLPTRIALAFSYILLYQGFLYYKK